MRPLVYARQAWRLLRQCLFKGNLTGSGAAISVAVLSVTRAQASLGLRPAPARRAA